MKPTNRQSKYRNRITTVDGVKFRSAKEAKRYQELKMLLRSGEITDLKLQPRFRLVVEMEYVADFQYHERTTGRRVVEDVKGFRTREYIRKKRLMLEQHAIEVKEI